MSGFRNSKNTAKNGVIQQKIYIVLEKGRVLRTPLPWIDQGSDTSSKQMFEFWEKLKLQTQVAYRRHMQYNSRELRPNTNKT